MTQFGDQNQQGATGEEVSVTSADHPFQSDSEGTYAPERDLLNAYDNPDVPPDVLIEMAGRFYTALEVNAGKKAAAPIARTHTYMLKGVSLGVTQLLRRDPLRRKAVISVVGDNTQPPLAFCQEAGTLQSLAGQLGAYAIGSQQLSGPYLLQPVGTQAPFDWESSGDLFVIAPFAMTNPLYVTVTEYIDS